jgi:hypothetical protein
VILTTCLDKSSELHSRVCAGGGVVSWCLTAVPCMHGVRTPLQQQQHPCVKHQVVRQDGKALYALGAGKAAVRAMEVSRSDGSRLVCAGDDGCVVCYEFKYF